MNQQITLWQQKESQYKADLLKVESRYTTMIKEFESRIVILTQERDTLVTKVGSNQQLRELEVKFEQQSLELAEVLKHLASAEEFIQQNTEAWEKAAEAVELLPEKDAIIDMLKKDLEIYRKQNEELDARVVQMEKII